MTPNRVSPTNLTAPELLWHASGEPPHKYTEEDHEGVCATCAAVITRGVDTTLVNNPTFSNHAEFFRFGTHVCLACAWMYGDPKRTHRNVLCVGERLWWPMISVESATEERPSWSEVLHAEVMNEPFGTEVCGVLTTDPKPRLWPRMRITRTPACGLYVHAPDYDISEYRELDLPSFAECVIRVEPALLAGFSKTRIHRGLLGDYAKAKRGMEGTMETERGLRDVRSWPEFVPALLVAQVTKEEKAEWKEMHDENGSKGTGDTGRSGARREARGEAREDHSRLF